MLLVLFVQFQRDHI